jgi:hypothetical protein
MDSAAIAFTAHTVEIIVFRPNLKFHIGEWLPEFSGLHDKKKHFFMWHRHLLLENKLV